MSQDLYDGLVSETMSSWGDLSDPYDMIYIYIHTHKRRFYDFRKPSFLQEGLAGSLSFVPTHLLYGNQAFLVSRSFQSSGKPMAGNCAEKNL